MGRKSIHSNLPKGMLARIRQRKNGKRVIYYFYSASENGKRKEISLGKDYHIAILKWAELDSSVLKKTNVVNFENIAQEFFLEKQNILSKNSLLSYKSAIKFLTEFFKGAPLDEIMPEHIKQYQRWRKDKPCKANLEIRVFNAIFNFALENEYIKSLNPSTHVKSLPLKKRDVYVEDHIFNAVHDCANELVRDLMDLAYITGQRPIDLVSIHSSQIYNGILHITQQKTKTKLRFLIEGKLEEILNKYLNKEGFLFKNNKRERLTRETLTFMFKKVKEKAIIKYPELAEDINIFQFRDIRAKSGTDAYLIEDREIARERLGHTSVNMTNRYIRKSKVIKPLK